MSDKLVVAAPAVPAVVEVIADPRGDPAFRRDRLLSALVILFGVALFLAAPFALRAGAVFFMPVTVALVVALMLVPLLEWLERRRVPAGLAALLALVGFLVIANATVVMIVLPAAEWVQLLPKHAAQVRANLSPIINAFNDLEKLGDQVAGAVGQQAASANDKVASQQPTSIVALIATSAPAVLVQAFVAILLVYFFLASWTAMRARAILDRETLTGSLRVARLLRDMVSGTAQYLLTITVINAALGAVVALLVWLLGMPTPLMWGGLAALFNFVPYAGPIVVFGLLALGGLIVFTEPLAALLPALAFLACHLVEANVVTPKVVGRRLTMSPVAILLALSFWGWVWGTVGALVSVPLLILLRVMLDRVGRPDVLGFMFDGRTLSRTTDTTA